MVFDNPHGEKQDDGQSEKFFYIEADTEKSGDNEAHATYANLQDERGGDDDGALYEGKLNDSISFIVDTGATDHIVNCLKYLINVRKLNRLKRITCVNKNDTADLIIEHVGDVIIIDDNNRLGCLKDVLYAP